MDDNGNFLSLPAFENKYALKARPLAFYMDSYLLFESRLT